MKGVVNYAFQFGNQLVILTGSTVKGLRLQSLKDEGDYDYLIISGITIHALEQRMDLDCFVHIRSDKLKTSFSKGMVVDEKYLLSKVLKEFEVTKESFPISSVLNLS